MSKKNILAIFIIMAAVLATVAVISAKPELHKTFEIQILKFIKADN